MSTPIPMSGFPGTYRPYTNIQPFTYRDGATYIEILMSLRKWLSDTLIPHIDKETEELVQAWAVNVETIMSKLAETLASVEGSNSDTVDLVTAELSAQTADVVAKLSAQSNSVTDKLNSQNTAVNTSLTQNKAYVDAAVQSVISATVAITDPIVNTLLGNTASSTFASVKGIANDASKGAIPTEYATSLVTRAFDRSAKNFIVSLGTDTNNPPLSSVGNVYNLANTEGLAWNNVRGAKVDIDQANGATVADGYGHYVGNYGTVSDFEQVVDGTEVAFLVRQYSNGGKIAVYIDGKLSGNLFSIGVNVRWVKLTFDRDEKRTIRISTIYAQIGQIAVMAGKTSAATNKRPIKAGWIGDSWAGDGSYAPAPFNWPCLVGEALNWGLTIDGRGGTGLTTNNVNYLDATRADYLVGKAFDIFVIQMSINDLNAANDAVRVALTSLIDKFKAGSPTTKLIVIGPQIRYSVGDPDYSKLLRLYTEAKQVIAANPNVVFISPIDYKWNSGDYQAKRNNRKMVGNVDWTMWDDGAHPTRIGAFKYAVNTVSEITLALSATQAASELSGEPFGVYPYKTEFPTAENFPVPSAVILSGTGTGTSVSLNWTSAKPYVDNYIVEMRSAGPDGVYGAWYGLGNSGRLNFNQTTATYGNLTVGRTYDVRVTAKNFKGSSTPSNILTYKAV